MDRRSRHSNTNLTLRIVVPGVLTKDRRSRRSNTKDRRSRVLTLRTVVLYYLTNNAELEFTAKKCKFKNKRMAMVGFEPPYATMRRSRAGSLIHNAYVTRHVSEPGIE